MQAHRCNLVVLYFLSINKMLKIIQVHFELKISRNFLQNNFLLLSFFSLSTDTHTHTHTHTHTQPNTCTQTHSTKTTTETKQNCWSTVITWSPHKYHTKFNLKLQYQCMWVLTVELFPEHSWTSLCFPGNLQVQHKESSTNENLFYFHTDNDEKCGFFFYQNPAVTEYSSPYSYSQDLWVGLVLNVPASRVWISRNRIDLLLKTTL